MRLLVVSHTAHHRQGQDVVGWGPTVREIDALAGLFEEVVHVAPLHPGAPPASALPYQSRRVVLRPVAPAGGGDGAVAKARAAWHTAGYAATVLREIRVADVVHVRCPANISLMSVLLLGLLPARQARWAKYAGNWNPVGGEPWSYRFQRWWLRRRGHRGVVTVNGCWPNQPPHVRTLFNPSFTQAELERARSAAAGKTLGSPVRLLFVGHLVGGKGIEVTIRALAGVRRAGVDATLDVAGDGPERVACQRLADGLGVTPYVTFHGWLARPDVAPLYTRAHLLLLPSSSEGWPKVLSEGMAYGAVPLASSVSCVPQYLDQFGSGRVYAPTDVFGYVEAVVEYVKHPGRWSEESTRGLAAASVFTYEHYLREVSSLLRNPG